MANFLNAGILGDGAGVANKRGFRPIATQYIDPPTYNAKYFETYPTVWACAYAFGKMLAAEGNVASGAPPTTEQLAAMEGATEEWASLFLLHYFGDLHLVSYDRATLEKDYDKDLWLAISGTYPASGDSAVTAIQLLETDAHTVVGGYYPETVFFPSRGRAQWTKDKKLAAYLDGTRLSWAKCSTLLLRGERERRDFHGHLELIARHALPSTTFQDRLRAFCENTFIGTIEPAGSLPSNPAAWEVPGNKQPESVEFLRNYPLQKPNNKGGTSYYLVNGMPQHADWMTVSTSAGWPAPHQYVETGNNQISVEFAGKKIICKISENEDDIVHLHKLFLADAPLWCKIPKVSDEHISRIKPLHKIELRDPVLTENDLAVCLAPISREFLAHFPQVFENLKSVTAVANREGSTIDWTFPVLGQEVKWQTKPTYSSELPRTSLAIWPPKTSSRWQHYAMFGTGAKDRGGRWHLVDEHGARGAPVDLDEEEYVSILKPTGSANRPRALMLTLGVSSDGADRERGVLFLAELPDQPMADAPASLSVDFGTSNTCLAFKRTESEILRFSLSPEMIWGKHGGLERPGFVPFKWSGVKGFFPTILLSRRIYADQLDALLPEHVHAEHLYKADVLGLHDGIERLLYEGSLNRTWRIHPNLKWELANSKSPWRSLFLGLTLLYAHAEVFFGGKEGAQKEGARINKYVFTYPLAFSEKKKEGFHNETKNTIRKIRLLCYGEEPAVSPPPDKFIYLDKVDESTAIARSARASKAATTMEVFIDVGGGTADIAVRNKDDFLVLDSIKVAGNAFFRFAAKNFDEPLHGAAEFQSHLAYILGSQDIKLTTKTVGLKLGEFYSVAINSLASDQTFRDRDAKIMEEGMGDKDTKASYQRYRARLFFRHILTYALLQACAAVVDRKLTLSDGLRLILGGNAWGLMLFAEFDRSGETLRQEVSDILQLLRQRLAEVVTKKEERQHLDSINLDKTTVTLLNETNLSKAKTDVALGALKAEERSGQVQELAYSGVTLRKLKVDTCNAMDVLWRDLWSFKDLKSKVGFGDEIANLDFEQSTGLHEPMDSILSVFTCLGTSGQKDKMPGATWRDINGEISASIRETKGNRLGLSPINHFLSHVLYPEDEQRDFLDTLAEANGNFKIDRR